MMGSKVCYLGSHDQVPLNGGVSEDQFLTRQGCLIFCFALLSWAKIRSKDNCISGQLLEQYFTQSLASSWGNLYFHHSFLVIP